jgi:hypothetical protein
MLSLKDRLDPAFNSKDQLPKKRKNRKLSPKGPSGSVLSSRGQLQLLSRKRKSKHLKGLHRGLSSDALRLPHLVPRLLQPPHQQLGYL